MRKSQYTQISMLPLRRCERCGATAVIARQGYRVHALCMDCMNRIAAAKIQLAVKVGLIRHRGNLLVLDDQSAATVFECLTHDNVEAAEAILRQVKEWQDV